MFQLRTSFYLSLKVLVALLLVIPVSAQAVVVSLDADQVGGFYADGSADNDITFQNYFIGYGTTPGFPRTEERRSFFKFDLSGVTGTVTSAEFSLRLPAFGLIFGTDCLGADPCTGPLPMVDDPATPWDDTDPGAWPKDPFEDFILGVTPIDSAIVTDTLLPPDDPGPGLGGTEVFDSFDDAPVADPFAFLPTDFFDFSTGSAEIVIPLSALGVTVLNDTIAAGGDLVLTGFMPSWSFEDRTTPLGDALVEKSELIFGLSDLISGGTPTGLASPFLELTITEIPLPAAAWLFGSGLLGLIGIARRKIA